MLLEQRAIHLPDDDITAGSIFNVTVKPERDCGTVRDDSDWRHMLQPGMLEGTGQSHSLQLVSIFSASANLQGIAQSHQI